MSRKPDTELRRLMLLIVERLLANGGVFDDAVIDAVLADDRTARLALARWWHFESTHGAFGSRWAKQFDVRQCEQCGGTYLRWHAKMRFCSRNCTRRARYAAMRAHHAALDGHTLPVETA